MCILLLIFVTVINSLIVNIYLCTLCFPHTHTLSHSLGWHSLVVMFVLCIITWFLFYFPYFSIAIRLCVCDVIYVVMLLCMLYFTACRCDICVNMYFEYCNWLLSDKHSQWMSQCLTLFVFFHRTSPHCSSMFSLLSLISSPSTCNVYHLMQLVFYMLQVIWVIVKINIVKQS